MYKGKKPQQLKVGARGPKIRRTTVAKEVKKGNCIAKKNPPK